MKVPLLQPKMRSKPWKPEEDQILLEKAKEFNYKNWADVAFYLPGRTGIQCSARYKRIQPGLNKGAWTKEEDEELLKLHKKYGNNWSSISKSMPKRTGKQIRDRYLNALEKNLKKEKFSEKEDYKIAKYFLLHGNAWSKIAEHLKGRTGDMVKNRFYSYLKNHLDLYIDMKTNKIKENPEFSEESEESEEDIKLLRKKKKLSVSKSRKCLSEKPKKKIKILRKKSLKIKENKENSPEEESKIRSLEKISQMGNATKIEKIADIIKQEGGTINDQQGTLFKIIKDNDKNNKINSVPNTQNDHLNIQSNLFKSNLQSENEKSNEHKGSISEEEKKSNKSLNFFANNFIKHPDLNAPLQIQNPPPNIFPLLDGNGLSPANDHLYSEFNAKIFEDNLDLAEDSIDNSNEIRKKREMLGNILKDKKDSEELESEELDKMLSILGEFNNYTNRKMDQVFKNDI